VRLAKGAGQVRLRQVVQHVHRHHHVEARVGEGQGAGVGRQVARVDLVDARHFARRRGQVGPQVRPDEVGALGAQERTELAAAAAQLEDALVLERLQQVQQRGVVELLPVGRLPDAEALRLLTHLAQARAAQLVPAALVRRDFIVRGHIRRESSSRRRPAG
jgi:hypothetical protein